MGAATIKKEIVTLRGLWNWAVQRDKLQGRFPSNGVRLPKSAEKPPFQTWDEIERQIARGGLSEAEQADLWDCLFLRLEEIAELLEYVRLSARHPFIYPMFVTAAHTGARRSELTRSQLHDFDKRSVTIRERKRIRGKKSTRRVPLAPMLRRVIGEWLKVHPGGNAMFCQVDVLRSKKTRTFPEPLTPDEANDHFKRTLKCSKWENLRGWHVFRHSFASNCALKGIDQRVIDEWLGHQTVEMTRRYRHLFPDSQQAAIERVFE